MANASTPYPASAFRVTRGSRIASQRTSPVFVVSTNWPAQAWFEPLGSLAALTLKLPFRNDRTRRGARIGHLYLPAVIFVGSPHRVLTATSWTSSVRGDATVATGAMHMASPSSVLALHNEDITMSDIHLLVRLRVYKGEGVWKKLTRIVFFPLQDDADVVARFSAKLTNSTGVALFRVGASSP